MTTLPVPGGIGMDWPRDMSGQHTLHFQDLAPQDFAFFYLVASIDTFRWLPSIPFLTALIKFLVPPASALNDAEWRGVFRAEADCDALIFT